MNKTVPTQVSSAGIERLRTLYSVLAGIPAPRVNMLDWREHNFTNKTMISHDCGTAACAVGWACANPELRKQGLDWSKNGCPTFEGKSGWGAVEAFFDLSEVDAYDMFSQPYGVGLFAKKGVLARIRQHLFYLGAITEKRSLELAAYEKSLRQ